MRSRLAVLLVADVVDYSRLMSDDEHRAIGAIRELKDTYLEPAVVERDGEILKRMGDGWIVAFSSITKAMQGAMAVQEGLVAHPLIKLRIGLHIGEIVEDETDFYGAGVNLAQRLQTEAPPGGIMISQDLHRQLTGDLAKAFTDAGSFKLKNITSPVTGFQWRPSARTAAPNEAGDLPTISVERFTYAPENRETEAATEDLRDQLIHSLSRRTGVRVLDEAQGGGRAVYILRGRLRLSSGRGRMTLSLIVRDSGETKWSRSYDGDAGDIFAFCDELIEKSVAGLRIQINAFDNDRIAALPDDRLSLSELRSRAAASFYKCTVESWTFARDLLDRAVRLNADDPTALAMRALAETFLATAHFQPLPAWRIEALANDLDRAVELAPRSDFVFSSRSFFRSNLHRDAPGALQDADRALSLNASYHIAYDARAEAHMLADRMDAAIVDLQKAVALGESDPLLPFRLFLLAIAYHLVGRSSEALETLDHALQLRSGQRRYHCLKAFICRATGRAGDAAEAERRAAQLPNEPSIVAPMPPLPERYGELVSALVPE